MHVLVFSSIIGVTAALFLGRHAAVLPVHSTGAYVNPAATAYARATPTPRPTMTRQYP